MVTQPCPALIAKFYHSAVPMIHVPLFPNPKKGHSSRLYLHYIIRSQQRLAILLDCFVRTSIVPVAYHHLICPPDAFCVTLILPVDLPEDTLLARIRRAIMFDRSYFAC